jgi:hypothetical protein
MFVACVCISFAGSRLRLESIVSRKDAKNAKVYCSRLRLEYIVPQRRKGRKVLTFSPSARKHCHAKAQRPQSIERETSNFSNAKRQTFQTLQTCNIKREASNRFTAWVLNSPKPRPNFHLWGNRDWAFRCRPNQRPSWQLLSASPRFRAGTPASAHLGNCGRSPSRCWSVCP